jgi:hypothetical protein
VVQRIFVICLAVLFNLCLACLSPCLINVFALVIQFFDFRKAHAGPLLGLVQVLSAEVVHFNFFESIMQGPDVL